MHCIVHVWVWSRYDYTAADDDEISVKDGDVLLDVMPDQAGWVAATHARTGARGTLPASYVTRGPQQPVKSSGSMQTQVEAPRDAGVGIDGAGPHVGAEAASDSATDGALEGGGQSTRAQKRAAARAKRAASEPASGRP
jgi:hypothetical protein